MVLLSIAAIAVVVLAAAGAHGQSARTSVDPGPGERIERELTETE